jgi:hypothetical protein
VLPVSISQATQFTADLVVAKPTIALGFTKQNELFVGRAAMVGVAAALVGEVLTGSGPLAQLGYEFHESVADVEIEVSTEGHCLLRGSGARPAHNGFPCTS